jgi:hypothetical protein
MKQEKTFIQSLTEQAMGSVHKKNSVVGKKLRESAEEDLLQRAVKNPRSQPALQSALKDNPHLVSDFEKQFGPVGQQQTHAQSGQAAPQTVAQNVHGKSTGRRNYPKHPVMLISQLAYEVPDLAWRLPTEEIQGGGFHGMNLMDFHRRIMELVREYKSVVWNLEAEGPEFAELSAKGEFPNEYQRWSQRVGRQ